MDIPHVTDIEHMNQQLSLPEVNGIEQERQLLISKITAIGEVVVGQIIERFQDSSFTYEDIVEFASDKGRNRAEAGKIFSRFYSGLKALGLEPPRNRAARRYEANRDQYAYPLYLLSHILSEVNDNPHSQDIYEDLLREFHTSRLDELLVKKTTSA